MYAHHSPKALTFLVGFLFLITFGLNHGNAQRSSTKDIKGIPNTQKLDIPITSPEDALDAIELPAGFEATLFAAEPDVHQPVAATFDEKGRLWVAECYTYSDRQENFNTRLNDRILIFDDSDNDGIFDSRKVFWDKGKRVTGIEIGHGGVWVTAAPHLLFIPDRDHNDLPDGPAEVLLDGFNDTTVRHNFVNGPKWGPDGWLYGRHGIMATSHVGPPGATESQRTALNCGIWRYHPTHRKFEVVAHGMTNPFGFDYDQHGEMFVINTVIGHLFHIVPGARYRRMYGSHFNSHTYQVIEQTADHFHWDVGNEDWTSIRKDGFSDATDAAGGGHAHSGLMIYQGLNWPEQFRGKLFTLNFHGRRMNSESLRREGNSYVASHGNDYFKTSDPWFRGVELLCGPDGGVFLLDWSDIGECHENDGIHRTSGRIFKLTYRKPEPLKYDNLSSLSDEQLVGLLKDPNQWYVRQARRILQERAFRIQSVSADRSRDEDAKLAARRRSTKLKKLIRDDRMVVKPVHQELQSMWTSYGCSFAGSNWLLARTDHDSEHVRSWAVRLLTDGIEPIDEATFNRLNQLATSDPSGLVRLHLASSLRRLDTKRAFELSERLANHSSDAKDRAQPKLIWYGIEPHVAEHPQWALDLADACRMPIIRTNIIRRLTCDIENQPKAMKRIVTMLENAKISDRRLEILSGMWLALDGIQHAPTPKNWNKVAAKLSVSGNEQTRNYVQRLNIVFGEGRAIDELKAIVSNNKADVEKRRRAILALAKGKPDPELFRLLRPLLTNRELIDCVTQAMVYCDQPGVADVILERYPFMTRQTQTSAINTLVVRKSWVRKLLDAIEESRIPVSIISSSHARQIRNFEDTELTRRLTNVWGQINSTSAERQRKISKLRRQLTPERLATATSSNGKRLYEKNCASCHVLRGIGGRIGPDLTGADRKNLNYLLENTIAPSAIVSESYQSSVIMLEDGRLLTGVVVEKNNRMLKLQTKDELLSIDRSLIEESKRTKLSLMPDGLIDQMTLQEKADLFRFLMQ